MAKTETKQEVSVVGGVVAVNYPTIKKGLSVDYDQLSPAMQRMAGLHGLKQKLGDAKSGGTASEKWEMAGRIIESILKGTWELSGGSESGKGLLIEALVEHTGRSEADVVKAVANADEEKLASWKKNSKVSAIMKRIAAERAAEKAAAADEEEVELD